MVLATTTDPSVSDFKTFIEKEDRRDTPISRAYQKKERMPYRVISDTTTFSFRGWGFIDESGSLSEQTFIQGRGWLDRFLPYPFGEIQAEYQPKEEIASDKINQTRLELLARQYVSKLSKEEEARLEIVSERIRRFFPRVTTQDFEAIEQILVDVNRIGEEHRQLRKQLGLDSSE